MSPTVNISLKTITLSDFFSQDFFPYSDIFSMRKKDKGFQLEILNDVPQKNALENEGCTKLLVLDTKELVNYDNIPKLDLIAALLKCLKAGDERDCSENIAISRDSSIQCSFHFLH